MTVKVSANLMLMLIIIAAAGLPISAIAQSATDDLKLYRSEADGFEVKYPSGWSVSAENKGNSLVVFFTSPVVRDDDVFQAARIMICSTPIDETPWTDCTERDSHLSEPSKDSVRSRIEFVVSELTAERVETASKYDDAFFYYARFSSNGRKFFMRGDFQKSFDLARYAPTFDKMLETFRLLSGAKPNNGMQRTRAAASPSWTLDGCSPLLPGVMLLWRCHRVGFDGRGCGRRC